MHVSGSVNSTVINTGVIEYALNPLMLKRSTVIVVRIYDIFEDNIGIDNDLTKIFQGELLVIS